MLRIAIIIGSTRPGRKAEAVAKWVYEIAQNRSDAEFELVDIKDFDLPLLDEPMSPIMGQYNKPHTKVAILDTDCPFGQQCERKISGKVWGLEALKE